MTTEEFTDKLDQFQFAVEAGDDHTWAPLFDEIIEAYEDLDADRLESDRQRDTMEALLDRAHAEIQRLQKLVDDCSDYAP
jgi:hypothetical protein